MRGRSWGEAKDMGIGLHNRAEGGILHPKKRSCYQAGFHLPRPLPLLHWVPLLCCESTHRQLMFSWSEASTPRGRCPFSASLPLIASQLCPFLVALRFGDNRCSGAWLVLLLIENYFPLLCNTWGKKGSSERAELLLWPTQVSYLHGILPCPQFSPGCFCSEIHCSKKNWERACSYSFCPHRSPSLSIPFSTFGTGMYQVIHMAIWYKVSCPCAGVLLTLISS